jgi:hypothetical protein
LIKLAGFTFDPLTLALILSFGTPLLIFIVLVIMDMKENNKAKVLYFESEKLCRMLSREVKDGAIRIRDKLIAVDKAHPAHIPSGMIVKSYRPFYVVKHDKALPFKFTDNGIEVISGSNLKNLTENKTLDQLLSPKNSSNAAILFLIIGAVIGGLFGYILAKGMV